MGKLLSTPKTTPKTGYVVSLQTKTRGEGAKYKHKRQQEISTTKRNAVDKLFESIIECCNTEASKGNHRYVYNWMGVEKGEWILQDPITRRMLSKKLAVEFGINAYIGKRKFYQDTFDVVYVKW